MPTPHTRIGTKRGGESEPSLRLLTGLLVAIVFLFAITVAALVYCFPAPSSPVDTPRAAPAKNGKRPAGRTPIRDVSKSRLEEPDNKGRLGAVVVAASGGAGIVLALLTLWSVWRHRQEVRRRFRMTRQELERARNEAAASKARLNEKNDEFDALVEEKRRQEERAEHEKQQVDQKAYLLRAAVESANDVVMITDADPGTPLRVVYVNDAFERMTGYSRAEILYRSPKMLQGPETDRAALTRIASRLRSGKPVETEILNYRKDGTTFWVELNIRPILDDRGWQTHWISVQRDITERKRAEDRIQWQADHDSLTRLPNRKYYQERLALALADAEAANTSVGVLFFDLDRFKQINDTLGHMAGDTLLQAIAGRLSARLGEGDVIARVGGDEFTILLPHVRSDEQASAVAQDLLDSLAEPFALEGHELFVTASIGVSLAPRDGTDIATLLKNADVAMYRAKDEGRDSFRVYHETMNARALDRLVLEASLRRAVERNELFLLYQPQVNMATGEVFGVEALIRWDHPQLGRVSPGQFIPLAEETGLIVEIGLWTLHEACRQAALWQRQGRNLRMSVNLSARQFEQRDLVDSVETALRETGLPPEFLDLELTEGTLLRGNEAAATLKSLKELGVRLSVDDFGTGYSSLSYLRNFPLDVLKIDRSFIMGLTEDHKSEAVVRALIALAHGVNLEVIAEGVETEAQRVALSEMACDAMQGYLFSAPTTPAEVESLADGVLRPLPPFAQRSPGASLK